MKLASIETILEIKPHPNADRLELAKILGWQCVVKRGKFNAGDRVVFIFTDTILPRTEWSEFLVDQKRPEKLIRLKTIKLRGEYSSGLVLPISVLTEHVQSWQEGVDVGGELGVKKYEKEIPSQLSGEPKCTFPLYLAPRTDEDNGLSDPRLVECVLNYAPSLLITKKLDGSSMTVIVEDGVITHVCSRNQSLVESSTNAFWIAARKLDIKIQGSCVLQGELMGPGIQGNQLGLMEPKFFIFQGKVQNGYVSYDEMRDFARIINAEVVPEIDYDGPWDLDSLQNLADIQRIGDVEQIPAEGIVVRPHRFDGYLTAGSGRPLGFKLINRNYRD